MDLVTGAQVTVAVIVPVGRNRYADGSTSMVTCEVTESDWLSRFAWNVLDDSGDVGSTWRYELSAAT